MMRAFLWSLIVWLAAIAPGSAADDRPLFDPGDQSVTFRLVDREGKTPRIILFRNPAQAATADSINYWRSTQDLQQPGVVVEFRGVRFLRSAARPDDLNVRLVGIKNELDLGKTVSLAGLSSGRPQRLHFGPTTLGGGPIAGTTDAEIVFTYDPRSRTLQITEVSGEFAWRRFFYEEQRDAGALRDITGVIGEVAPGGVVLKPDAAAMP